MNRLRLADVRVPIARVANLCSTSSEVVDLANEAHRRLVSKGSWVGCVQRYRICTSATGCLTWPRQIETILSYWLCDTPGTVRNGWYEVSLAGPGLQNGDDSNAYTLIDRGTSAVFDEIDGTDSKVMVQASVSEATDKRILIRGYDENANWIRTQDNGVWIDGEYVTIGTIARYTTHYFTKITEVVKDVTNGPVSIWQYDTSLASATRQLGWYEPDETVPIYRCSLIPGLSNVGGCGSHSSDDDDDSCSSNTQLTVTAKLRHIDVVVDNDFFLLGSLSALKLMVMSILKEEKNLFDEAQAYEAKALKELQDELHSYEGDGQVPTIRQESSQTWGAGILNPLSLGYRIY
jgi:hypothetical protein